MNEARCIGGARRGAQRIGAYEVNGNNKRVSIDRSPAAFSGTRSGEGVSDVLQPLSANLQRE